MRWDERVLYPSAQPGTTASLWWNCPFPRSNQMVLEGTANHKIRLTAWLCHRLILLAAGVGAGMGMLPKSGLSETSPGKFLIIINEVWIAEWHFLFVPQSRAACGHSFKIMRMAVLCRRKQRRDKKWEKSLDKTVLVKLYLCPCRELMFMLRVLIHTACEALSIKLIAHNKCS